MMWYLALSIFTGYHLLLHAMLHAPGNYFFTLSTTALFISVIFLLSTVYSILLVIFNVVLVVDRFIYLILILGGVMDQNPQVDVVFSSFPALLFYVIYSIIVIRW